MRGDLLDHDRAATAPDRAPAALLTAGLDGLRLQSALFLAGDCSGAWAYESLPSDTAAVLAPEAGQVVRLHLVASGRCWVEVPGEDRHWANAGDVIVLPYDDPHRMGGTRPAPCVSFGQLLEPRPWARRPHLRLGQGGTTTSVVCGFLVSDDPLFDPRLRAFPPVFVVSPPGGPARAWVRSSVDYALQQTIRVTADRFAAPTAIPELLLREVLRLHLASAPAAASGWVRALRDPVLAPALAALHREPGRKWTVADLARHANASASLLDDRFREVLGLPPIRYLTGWRMHLAEDLLRSSDLSVTVVARRVGYDAEESFSRAFKRAHGAAPSVWRVQRPR